MGQLSPWVVATGAPVCVVVNGKTLTFNRLKRRQNAELVARWASEDRAKYRKFLAAENVSESERLARLAAFDRQAATLGYGDLCIFQPDRFDDVLKAAANGTADDASIEALPAHMAEKIVVECWGRLDIDAVVDAEEPDPKAQPPATIAPSTG